MTEIAKLRLAMGRGDEELERWASRLGDERARAAWRSWLGALAEDAEAALAAALAYDALEPAHRDAWLDALRADADAIAAPRVALYAPLLFVEGDDVRRRRIAEECAGAPLGGQTRAWLGHGERGEHVCVVVVPLYLRFVETLQCRYEPDEGIVSARHDPLCLADDVDRTEVEGVALQNVPLGFVVEDLAHAILSDRRAGRDAPPAVTAFARLFSPEQGALAGAPP